MPACTSGVRRQFLRSRPMYFDDQLRRNFGSPDLATVSPAVLADGTERMLVDFGLEKDRARRFAIWSLLFILGSAPDLDIAFKSEEDRDAARSFMDMIAAAQGED
jgi:hypothetical protein